MLITAADPVSRPRTVNIAATLMWLALAEVLFEIVLKDFSQTSLDSRAIDLSISILIFAPGIFLVYMIWQGRNWARVTYLVLTILGMFMTVPVLRAELANTPIRGAISVAIVAIQLFAVYLVYAFPGKTWFAGRPQSL